MLKRVLTLGFIAVLAVILAGSTSLKPGIADTGYSLQGQGKGAEKRHDNGEFLALLTVGGAVFSDAEGEVVTVGVEQAGQCNAVREKGRELGIDPVCIVTSPIVPLDTLQDRIRPLQGGIQIRFSNFLCTESFNATRAGVAGFTVASHCTAKRGEVGTKHYQPLAQVDADLIGTETVDPKFFTCVKGKKCRYSDSAFDQLAPNVTATLGSIARPDGVNTRSLTIAGSFRVVAEAPSNATVGETLNKVGRTTGWSQGPVTRSCVNTGVFGTNIIMLCQDFVRALVEGGDSGSPVFKITNSPNEHDASLYGILWGGGGDEFVYSPMANVQRSDELGSLTTCAAGFTC